MSNSRVISGSTSGILDVARAWNIGVVQSTNSIPIVTADNINHTGKVSIGQIAVGETLDVLGTFLVTNTFASTGVGKLGVNIPLIGLPAGVEGVGMNYTKGTKTVGIFCADLSPLGGSFEDDQVGFLAQDTGNSDLVVLLADTNTDPAIAMQVLKGASGVLI